MRKMTTLALIALLTTPACARIAESRLNPLNLFKGSGETPRDANGNVVPLIAPGTQVAPVDSRGLIGTVDAVELIRTPNGAIVRATGRAAGQGGFNAQLVPVSNAGGVLRMAFRIAMPQVQPAGARAQQITVARVIPARELAGITSIQVQGAQNVQTVRR